MQKPVVEIAICTWNRSELLSKTLQRISNVSKNWSTVAVWRILLVDNNSTDRTPELATSFAKRMDLKYVFEDTQGHVHARNKAVDESAGDLLLWTDDDVLVNDTWLPSYVSAAKAQPDVTFWGGNIRPVFLNRQPEWIRQNWDIVKGCFAERDLGAEAFSFDKQTLPYGANFAIRTQIQKSNRYDDSLGRNEIAVVGEDELELFRKLIDLGHTGKWVPDSNVEHMIDSPRATPEFIARYFEGQGRSLVAKGEPWTSDLQKLKKEAEHELLWFRMKRHFSRSQVWVSHLVRGSLAKGQLDALCAANRIP